MDAVDAGLLLIRLVLGITMLTHGLNHLLGGGRLPGAAGWFESLGLRPGMLHAWFSTLTEMAAGVGLLLGFLTPLAAAATVGLMAVAGIVAHRPNGFFIFKEGYEYVLMIAVLAVALAAMGPGSASVDDALDIVVDGWTGALIALGLGLAGAVALLVTSWRPSRVPAGR